MTPESAVVLMFSFVLDTSYMLVLELSAVFATFNLDISEFYARYI